MAWAKIKEKKIKQMNKQTNKQRDTIVGVQGEALEEKVK